MADPMPGKYPAQNELEFGIAVAQFYRTWPELREQFQWADESGWDSAWLADHFCTIRPGGGDETGACLESWTLLAALARETQQVRLGVLVTGITHRPPAVLFKEVVTVDHLSEGRLLLGVGAARHEREHIAYGLSFPAPADRVDMLGEAMEMYRLLETQDRTTFEGKHYQLVDAPFDPKPVNGHVPILIGATGKRMLRHVARYADQWDGGGSPTEYAARGAVLTQYCSEIGRDPSEIRWALVCGPQFLESDDALREHVAAYSAIGVRAFRFIILGGAPTASMRRIAEQTIPDLRARFREGAALT